MIIMFFLLVTTNRKVNNLDRPTTFEILFVDQIIITVIGFLSASYLITKMLDMKLNMPVMIFRAAAPFTLIELTIDVNNFLKVYKTILNKFFSYYIEVYAAPNDRSIFFFWWIFFPFCLFLGWSVSFSFWQFEILFVICALLISLTKVSCYYYLFVSLVLGLLTIGTSVDQISYPFLVLTSFIFPLVIVASIDTTRKDTSFFYQLLLIIQLLLVVLFNLSNFFLFYIIFEVLAFPMFLLIGVYGPRSQRVQAAYKFFIYTFLGSILMLLGLLLLYFLVGSVDQSYLQGLCLSEESQIFFFALVFPAFAVKIPMMPFHLWLPEAHVEAPTSISILLASLLLKTGGYALIKFVLPLFPMGVYYWSPLVNSMAVYSVLAASVIALVQVDMKKLIAYSSVAHMNVSLLGVMSGSILGIQGGMYLMLAHAFTSTGLFSGIGVLYDRYHTRNLIYYSGLIQVMPLFGLLYFGLILGNLSFPFTGGFTAEFIILSELIRKNLLLGLLTGLTVFFSLVYSVWFYNRIFYGPISSYFYCHQDLTSKELCVLFSSLVGTFGLGFTGYYLVYLTYFDYSQTLIFFNRS